MASHDRLNLVLDPFDRSTLERIGAQSAAYETGAILYSPQDVPEYFYFPHIDCVISVVRSTESGSTVETGLTGYEGFVDVQSLITDPEPTVSEAVVQIGGVITRIPARNAREWFRSEVQFRDRALAFTSTFLHQVMQNALCNRVHSIEQRLAKWILTVRDRLSTDDIHLTQEFLSHMLGIHRPGVSIAIAALEVDGLIKHSRTLITIRDHAGLLKKVCECHAIVHANLKRLRSTLHDERTQSDGQ
jgi:CRP-like cAMP-binding protein